MSRYVLLFVALAFVDIVAADPHRPGSYLDHDRTVVNCAKYKREANQHSCVLSTFNTEGPYFLPDDLERSDITDGQVGVPLTLKINLVNSNDCTPLENMFVHIWHANAEGSYSGVENLGQDGKEFPEISGKTPPPDDDEDDDDDDDNEEDKYDDDDENDETDETGENEETDEKDANEETDDDDDDENDNDVDDDDDNDEEDEEDEEDDHKGIKGYARTIPVTNERFCRGYQVSDANGQVTFRTIVPGWYFGRSLHIHIEVYHRNTTEEGEITYVGQIFFDRELPLQLKLIEPYSTNTQRLTLNEDDWIYNNHGNESILNLISDGPSYSSSITFGINPDHKMGSRH